MGESRKDGVEEVGETGLVNKHIMILEKCRRKYVDRQGYEFMTVYDTIVSMGAQYRKVKLASG
jgi:hypothetical protein